jgi:hypothetical protein
VHCWLGDEVFYFVNVVCFNTSSKTTRNEVSNKWLNRPHTCSSGFAVSVTLDAPSILPFSCANDPLPDPSSLWEENGHVRLHLRKLYHLRNPPLEGRSCRKHNNRRPSSAAAAFIRTLSANRRFSFTIASAASPHSVGYSGADESPSHCTWQSAISWRHHSTAAPIVQRKQQRRRADFLAGQLRELRRELGGERRWDRHAEADGA